MSDAAALRDLEPAEAELVARHPLPEGVPDALVNKRELAHALNVSETTLDKWKATGLPVEEAGTNGRGYVFRLSVCFAWARARDAAQEAERANAMGAAHQLRMALVGGASAAGDRVRLSPKEQRELLELEHAYMIAARDRGELMLAEEVAATFESVFAAIRDALDALPDRLARELSLDGRGIQAAQVIADDVLASAKREVEELLGDAGGVGD